MKMVNGIGKNDGEEKMGFGWSLEMMGRGFLWLQWDVREDERGCKGKVFGLRRMRDDEDEVKKYFKFKMIFMFVCNIQFYL